MWILLKSQSQMRFSAAPAIQKKKGNLYRGSIGTCKTISVEIGALRFPLGRKRVVDIVKANKQSARTRLPPLGTDTMSDRIKQQKQK